MFFKIVCLNVSCGYSSEISKEDYDSFDFSCPECHDIACTYNSSTNDVPEEAIDFLLPLIVDENEYIEK